MNYLLILKFFQTYQLWHAFNSGKIPITLDSGLLNSVLNPEADLSDLDGDATPQYWLCNSCGMHDNNNILQKFIKNLSAEMKRNDQSNFDEEFKKIENCINSADSRKERKNPGCAKSLNDLLNELEMTDEHKNWLAKLKHADFEEKSDEEKSSIISDITRFPMIKPIFRIRFRSMASGLQNILAAKPIIQQAALITSPHRELLPSGDLDWNIVQSVCKIFAAVSQQTDMFESLTASSGQHIQSYFDLLSTTFTKATPTTPR